MSKYLPLTKFWNDKRANFGVTAAFLAVPLFMAAGLGVDYSRLSLVRSELQSAADSAALAAISKASETYKAGGKFNSAWSKKDANGDAMSWFAANHSTAFGYTVTAADADIKRVGIDLVATVNVAATVKMSFMGMFGDATRPVRATSTAASALAPYLDVHVVADNSPSMALGATPADISRLRTVAGCAFACHDLSGGQNTYQKALDNNIPLRIDAARDALAAMFAMMQRIRAQTNQFRVAAYHFGDKVELQQLTNFVAQTTDLARAKSDSENLKLMTVPFYNYNMNMASNLDQKIEQVAAVIGTSGSGTTVTDRRQMLFLITDGVNSIYKPASCARPMSPEGQCHTPINPALCKTLKDRGVEIAVVYVTYYPVGNPYFNDWIKPFQSEIASKLEECASSGLFAEVKPADTIENAMQAVFFESYPQPRLTN